jgi:hypothetical protein
MRITPNLSKISKEQMYDLLRARYRKTYDEAKQEGDQNILIFRESIDVIQLYDWWLLNIKNDEVMSKRRFEKMDFSRKEQFLKMLVLCNMHLDYCLNGMDWRYQHLENLYNI